ncbi:glucose-6-phosphate dehydrogenase assembly protein OpcA [Curtobacterium sp. MCSS17_007]|uniref:glucose-6-phosphate dehydrogenase assembly protein OpcA n=1 Tax=Curtobacterium sp. MCSS17_007 TaxID=2175646 RepID=UPI000DA9A5B1|nr:glucose-6-phosphate dehydrogenase assembly protein OpcA [Curtobacterium sp. MCSS17_007]WIE74260.1 glucose-6-phosphate dehydrogenase assembly protein OpcA [Curtobacterium sp. MCSS17_007]
MKIDMPNTTVSKIQKKLVHIREEGGAVALGRVLTLIISTALGHEEEAISAANEASREHPMRVIIVSKNDGDTKSPGRLDAQIRVGSDAGASEVIVLRAYGETATDEESLVTGLLLPDAPVVAWWPQTAPEQPAASALGRIAQRRITDAAAQKDPNGAIEALGKSYVPGDTDFAWTRLTLWRNQLAAALDQPPYEPVTGVEVSGASDSPSTILLAAWLQLQLQVPVSVVTSPRATGSSGIHGVKLERASGAIDLERSLVDVATLSMPGQPTHDLSLPRRNLRDCLAEELRRLDPDVLFGDVVKHGVPQLRESIAG